MQSLPKPAQYLLRVDDLCPTVHYDRWSGIRNLIREFRIRPILSVVPDNHDTTLEKWTEQSGFWAEMRDLEREGATIAMHGYRHLCEVRGRSLVPLHRRSEFAGQPLNVQREYIRAGMALLRNEGLRPRLFVAPKHGFDRATLRALRQEGLPFLSDGFARVPFKRDEVTWIPQQLWSPASRTSGLWTICIHPNSTGTRRTAELRGFLSRYRDQFTAFDDVIANFRPGGLTLSERMYARLAMWRVILRMKRDRPRN
jgi:predicted deacetylase